MVETKYGKYIIKKPKPNVTPPKWSSGSLRSGKATRVAYLDSELLDEAFYMECVWWEKESTEDRPTQAHTHDFDEILGFFGSNTAEPFDLGGEVELWLGDEKHIINESCLVFVPKGLKHCPLYFRRVDRPIFHFSTGPKGMYLGVNK